MGACRRPPATAFVPSSPAEITDAARRQLAEVGASALSLRAVAREVGMVSSAVYRYFPSRDDLLTRLIIDGYDEVGAAAEAADAPDAPPRDRWLAVCRAVRAWARSHPHEYALLYGSPVPGYRAPQDTVPAAARVALVLGRILGDAAASGALPPADGARDPALVSDDAVAVLGGDHPAFDDAVRDPRPAGVELALRDDQLRALRALRRLGARTATATSIAP